MISQIKTIIYILLTASMFTNCTSTYKPALTNIAMLSKKGENIVNVGVNSTGIIYTNKASSLQVNLSGAYALSDKYTLMGSAFYGFSYPLSDNISQRNYKNWNSELGIGRHWLKPNNRMVELFTGINYGHFYSEQNAAHGALFLQGNMGINKTHAVFAFSAKISGSYFNYTENYYWGYTDNNKFPAITAQLGGLIRLGSDHFKWWFSPGINFSWPFVNSRHNELGFTNNYFSNLTNLSMGLSYCIHKKNSKKH